MFVIMEFFIMCSCQHSTANILLLYIGLQNLYPYYPYDNLKKSPPKGYISPQQKKQNK